jgi:hypothetical protein
VPLEYREDPDLWYAMQESLGEQRPTIDLNLTEKTQSTSKSFITRVMIIIVDIVEFDQHQISFVSNQPL